MSSRPYTVCQSLIALLDFSRIIHHGPLDFAGKSRLGQDLIRCLPDRCSIQSHESIVIAHSQHGPRRIGLLRALSFKQRTQSTSRKYPITRRKETDKGIEYVRRAFYAVSSRQHSVRVFHNAWPGQDDLHRLVLHDVRISFSLSMNMSQLLLLHPSLIRSNSYSGRIRTPGRRDTAGQAL